MKIIIVIITALTFTAGIFFFWNTNTKPAYATNSTDLKYVALGDSITYGVGVNSPYPTKYKDYLNSDLSIPISLTNLGVPFWFSSSLLYALNNDQTYKDAVKNANLVTILIGLNDYQAAKYLYDQGTCYDAQYNNDCFTFISNNLSSNLTNIISQIKSLNTNPNLVILLSDFYNPYIAQYDPETAAIFFPYLTQLNNIIHSVSATNGLAVTNVYQAYNGANGLVDPIAKGYIVDGLHPSDSGHNVIANQFRSLNSYVLAKDFDSDGFSNEVEKRMTTNILASCPTPTKTNAWPPDVSTTDNLGKVTVADIVAVVNKYFTNDPRYDFDGDGFVRVSDILTVRNHYFQICPQ